MDRALLRAALSVAPLLLSACVGPDPRLGPAFAEPDTRPARAFTSFAPALDCMDELLRTQGRGRYLISSTDIPDETNQIAVGADDMLINALTRMNRSARRYIFVDQALIKFGGLLDTAVQNGDEAVPQLYIRGAISQLDRDVASDSGSAELTPGSGNLTGTRFGPYRKLSVVSVDMHLVEFPSRRVLPGASVANSMVVVGKGFGTSASGVINMATLGLSLQINRIESQSHAVRNLVELGLIELIGRHAGVPYWTCLAEPETDALGNERKEKRFVRRVPAPLPEVQRMLAVLGYLDSPFESTLGPRTRAAIARFQADEDLLPNGVLDHDLSERLKRKTRGRMHIEPDPRSAVARGRAGRAAVEASNASRSGSTTPSAPAPAPLPAPAPAPPPSAPRADRGADVPAEERGITCPTSSPGKPCDDGYINLYDFLKQRSR